MKLEIVIRADGKELWRGTTTDITMISPPSATVDGPSPSFSEKWMNRWGDWRTVKGIEGLAELAKRRIEAKELTEDEFYILNKAVRYFLHKKGIEPHKYLIDNIMELCLRRSWTDEIVAGIFLEAVKKGELEGEA